MTRIRGAPKCRGALFALSELLHPAGPSTAPERPAGFINTDWSRNVMLFAGKGTHFQSGSVFRYFDNSGKNADIN